MEDIVRQFESPILNIYIGSLIKQTLKTELKKKRD